MCCCLLGQMDLLAVTSESCIIILIYLLARNHSCRDIVIQIWIGDWALPVLYPQLAGCMNHIQCGAVTHGGDMYAQRLHPTVGREAAWESEGTLHSCCNHARFVPEKHLLHHQEENLINLARKLSSRLSAQYSCDGGRAVTVAKAGQKK